MNEKILEIQKKLEAPFHPNQVLWRIGRKSKEKNKAEVLAYIDARAIHERLNEVVGCDNWKVEYTPVDLGMIEVKEKDTIVKKHIKGFICSLSIRIDGEWVTKQDGADVTDTEPFKGGLSGAFKRVAAVWGIGRYLYNLPPTWVEIDSYGNFKPPTLPDWALPEGYKPQTEDKNPDDVNSIEEAKEVISDIGFTKGKKLGTLTQKQLEFLKAKASGIVQKAATMLLEQE